MGHEDFEREALPHAEALFRYARRLSRGDPEAEDLVQECFLRALRSFHTYRAGTNCRAWLFRILHNVHVSRLRRLRPEDSLDDLEEHVLYDRLAARGEDVESAFFGDGFGEDVARALEDLPEQHRAALLLCDVEGFAYHEIADVLDVAPGTVASRISRARSRLQRSLLEQRGA